MPEEKDGEKKKNPHAVALGRLGGLASTAGRMEKIPANKRRSMAKKASKAAVIARKNIPPEQRKAIAKKAAAARWKQEKVK